MNNKVAGALTLFLLMLCGTATASAAGPGSTFLTSYLDLPAGAIPGGASGYGHDEATASPLSADGRYVAFISTANRMAPGAHPDMANIFRKDRVTGETLLISRGSGAEAPGPARNSWEPRISADGNLVAFITAAALTPDDTDSFEDAYVRNVAAGTTTLATPFTTTANVNQADLSANGQYVAFATSELLVAGDLNGSQDVYRRDLSDGSIELVTRAFGSANAANDSSFSPSISGDGRFVAFTSEATNLVNGFIDNNGANYADVFVRDISGAQSQVASNRFNSPVNGGNDESGEPDIAGTPAVFDDVKVAYSSGATDVANGGVDADGASTVYLKDFPIFSSALISQSTGGVNADSRAHTPSISANGRRITFSSDAQNLWPDPDYYGTYLRDLDAGTTTLESQDNSYAVQGEISASGNAMTWVEGGSAASGAEPGYYGVFARTIPGGQVEYASRPAGNAPFLNVAAEVRSDGGYRLISADGRYQLMISGSSRLPGGATEEETLQVYRRDLKTGEIVLVSRRDGAAGAASEYADQGSISADGNRVAFFTYSKLDPADTDDLADVYVRDIAANTTTLVSRATGATGPDSNGSSGSPVISGDGNRVAFVSEAGNLDGANGFAQVYVRDLGSHQTLLVSASAGTAGNGNSNDPTISGDGRKVGFSTQATNLDPVLDPDASSDIYVKNLGDDSLQLVSRRPGLDGAKSDSFSYEPAISADGGTIAFESYDPAMAPEAGPWPAGPRQVVARRLATGENILVSRAPGGAPATQGASAATISGDGRVIGFTSYSDNLLPGLGASNVDAVFAKDLSTGALSGPPAFGTPGGQPSPGAISPSISEDGRCLAFIASGYNQISGDASDLRAAYVYVVSGDCDDPRNQPVPDDPPPGANVPVLSKVSLKPKKFAVGKKPTAKVAAKVAAKKKRKSPKGTKVRFTIDVKATVALVIQRKSAGRKVGGKCRKPRKGNRGKKKCARFTTVGKLQRKNLAAGARVVPFSGRIGKKKLSPGKYRAAIRASNQVGSSRTVNRPFVIVRR